MKIAVEAACWLNGRGYGRHLRSLLRALLQEDSHNQYTLCFDYQPEPGTVPAGCEFRVAGAKVPAAIAASAAGRRSLADMFRLSRLLSDPEFDLVLFPTVYSFVPVTGRATRLVMIHDVIAETFPHLTVPSPAARLFWNLKVAWARRQADAIVTVSEYSKRGILDRFSLPEDRVFLVGEASDEAFRRLDHPDLTPLLTGLGLSSGQRFVVYVGGFSPHKNLDALVRAFAAITDENVRLVMVGDYEREVFHSYYSTIRALVDSKGLAGRVTFAGFVPDEDLAVLLNLAEVLVLPSLMEGFGLPAVEAAACGCPVIATTASPLPELLPGAGLFVESNEAELSRALAAVLGSAELRQRMGAAGVVAAGRLTWAAAARQMLEIFETVQSRKNRV